MRRISDLVEDQVLGTPFLEQALADRVVNYSALARQLRPGIERTVMRRVSDGAVMMALRRLAPNLPRARRLRAQTALPPGELTVRSNLVEFTFHHSSTIREKQRRLLARLGRSGEGFFTYTQGVSEAMLIVGAAHERAVREVFGGEHLIAEVRNLSAIVIRLPAATVTTPGVYYAILKQLAWYNINVVDVVSTYTEFTIVLEDARVDVAFAALRRFTWSGFSRPANSRNRRQGRPA
jgi:hypothetical protein